MLIRISKIRIWKFEIYDIIYNRLNYKISVCNLKFKIEINYKFLRSGVKDLWKWMDL